MTSLAFSCSRWAAVVAWLALPIVGCTQVTDEPPSVLLRLTVFTGFRSTRVEGVEVCDGGMTKCSMTNAEGQATLELPPDDEITWTLTKKDFGSTLLADVTDATLASSTSVDLATDAWNERIYERLGLPYPLMGTGSVVIFVDPPLEGVTFELVEGTGRGPFYSDAQREPTPGFNATTSSGTGAFGEIPPGDVEVKIGGTADNCRVGWGWPGDGNNTVRMPVMEGFTTYASVNCN